MKIIRHVLSKTGITATAGIGTNMYLCKVAMDIVAKKMPPDEDGVRIAELDEMTYRKLLWEHTPLTDFWRVGKGIANRLAQYNILTMGDVVMWPDALLNMRDSCTRCLEPMRNCLLTMPGDGNQLPWSM